MPNMNAEFENACETIDRYLENEPTMLDNTIRDQFKSYLDRFNRTWRDMEIKAINMRNKEYETDE